MAVNTIISVERQQSVQLLQLKSWVDVGWARRNDAADAAFWLATGQRLQCMLIGRPSVDNCRH